MSNVSELPKPPPPPRRCEFPNCPTHDQTVGLVKIFKRCLCPVHRKILLTAHSFLLQVADDAKKEKAEQGVIERIQSISERKERVFVVDKQLMDDIRGTLTDQAARIKVLEDDRPAVSSNQEET